MTMYHVISSEGREYGVGTGSLKLAKEIADTKRAENGVNYFVEARDRIYTTSTLEEAIKGTPFDPAYVAP